MATGGRGGCPEIVRGIIAVTFVLLTAGVAGAQPADLSGVDVCERARTMIKKGAEPGLVELYFQLCEQSGEATDGDRKGRMLLAQGIGGTHAAVRVELAEPVDGAVGFVDTLADVPFPLPGVVFLPAGTHQVAAIAPGHHGGARQVTVAAGDDVSVSLALEPIGADEGRTDGKVDFSEHGEAGTVTQSTDLPEAEHDELLPDRFRRGLTATRGREPVAPAKRYRIGGSLGLTAADLTGDGAGDADGRLGLGAAALVRYRIRGGLHAEAELGYAPHGTDPVGVDYLTIPLRAAYAIGAGPIELQLGAGPAVGIALASDDAIDPRPLDVGLSGNLALLIPAGPGMIRIDYGLFVGATEIADGADARNLASALRAGYLF